MMNSFHQKILFFEENPNMAQLLLLAHKSSVILKMDAPFDLNQSMFIHFFIAGPLQFVVMGQLQNN